MTRVLLFIALFACGMPLSLDTMNAQSPAATGTKQVEQTGPEKNEAESPAETEESRAETLDEYKQKLDALRAYDKEKLQKEKGSPAMDVWAPLALFVGLLALILVGYKKYVNKAVADNNQRLDRIIELMEMQAKRSEDDPRER